MGNLFPDNSAEIAQIESDIAQLELDKQDIADKAQANGYASLDSSAKIPVNELPDSILGALKFKGTWNATTGIITSADPALNGQTPPAAAPANEGFYFITQVAGSYSIDGIAAWNIGDWLVSLGTTWAKIDNTDSVVSVAGKTGVVTLVSGDVGLGNVDNTSDLDKPVSTATQTALNAKVTANSAIAGATKTKVTYDSKGLVTGGTDATTADIAPSTDRNYTTDAQQVVLGNTSGVNSGNETAQSIGNIIAGATAKATPVDADQLGLMDSTAGNIIRKLSWANVKATLKTYFDTLYPAGSGTSTGTNTGDDKTAVNGLLKGNGSTISAAVSGTDYAPATSGSSVLKGNGAGGTASAVANTDYLPATTGSAIQKASGGGLAAAVAGTDYVAPTTGSAVQKANGAGGLTAAVANTDYLPATTGSALQKASGSGGLTAAVAGTDYQVPVTNASTGTLLNSASAKTTPVDADLVGVADSAASFAQVKVTWANIKATLKTYFDTLYLSVTAAATQSTPADPATTTSGTGVMMGLAGTVTPVRSGKVLITITGDIDNSGSGNSAIAQIRTGTGAAPANGAALTGTTRGNPVQCTNPTVALANPVCRFPFTLNALVTGLTLNTAVWIDTSLAQSGGSTARIRNLTITAVEL